MTDIVDDFERASLGPNWSAGNLQISETVPGTVTATGGGFTPGYYSAANFQANQYSEVVIHAINLASLAPVVRNMPGANTFYYAYCDGASGVGIWKCVAGAFSMVAGGGNFARNLMAGDVVRLAVNGTGLQVLLNGVVILSGSDSEITNGYPGFMFQAFQAADAVNIASWLGGPLLEASSGLRELITRRMSGVGGGLMGGMQG